MINRENIYIFALTDASGTNGKQYFNHFFFMKVQFKFVSKLSSITPSFGRKDCKVFIGTSGSIKRKTKKIKKE